MVREYIVYGVIRQIITIEKPHIYLNGDSGRLNGGIIGKFKNLMIQRFKRID